MKTFHYQILRYMPDRVSGEFVNIGVVVYEPNERKLAGKFFEKITRVSGFFPSINSRHLATSLKFLQREFDTLASRSIVEFNFDKENSLYQITKRVLPVDDSSLFFTQVKETLELNIEIVTKTLYRRFVLNYVEDADREYINDKEVWNKIYKSYFETYGISNHLQNHTVKTQLDTWEFDKAWKNGVWNCFETVSFDLLKSESIKDKVYKWSGKINELQTSKEPIHVYLLTKLPVEHQELDNFIKRKLGKIEFNNNVTVELVSEENAEKLAKKFQKQIEQHTN
ncbi:MAG: DUF3037 domain-containing protein [Ferruginibacter sp.]|nr:DUF3037 domain-containing protein [Ferruginibacter sp.]